MAARRARRSPSPACGGGGRAAPGEGAPEPVPESCKGVIECGQHLRISALEISRHPIIHRLRPAPIRPPGNFPRKRGKGSRISLRNEKPPQCGACSPPSAATATFPHTRTTYTHLFDYSHTFSYQRSTQKATG